jgi:hypothetical protein
MPFEGWEFGRSREDEVIEANQNRQERWHTWQPAEQRRHAETFEAAKY